MSMILCKQTPKADIIGTSKVGSITARMCDLIEIFGDPEHYHHLDEKVQYQWVLTFIEDGIEHVATIYDWKEYRSIDRYETISWSIGGQSPMANHLVHEFMEGMYE